MKLMNIVGWRRTKAQKTALKAKRKERRYKREAGKYAFQEQLMNSSITRQINRGRKKHTLA